MKKFSLPLIQTLAVGAILLSYYATTWFGDEFVLRAEPYDPWDPFYGEYVLLQYPDINDAVRDAGFQDGDRVHFSLTEGEDGYATIDRIEAENFFGALDGTYWGNMVSVENLEQFYVEQGQGLALEEAVDLKATIYVSPWGTIRPVDLEPREE